jgi:hypothetical protein
MSNQTEELLRDGMNRFTADVSTPRGLAARAVRHRQRRKLAGGMAASAAIATTAGVAVAVVAASAPAPGLATHAQTAAYVVSRAEVALADSQNLVQYVRQTKPDFPITLLPPTFRFHTGNVVTWRYHGRTRTEYGTSFGRPDLDLGSTRAGDRVTGTAVSYPQKRWWQGTVTSSRTPPVSVCSAPVILGDTGNGTDWATLVRQALKCGAYQTAGTEQVDGVAAVKLVPATLPDLGIVLWVDPSTYLPVRVRGTTVDGHLLSQADIRWLPPTAANLANLDVPIPAGFTQIQAPAANLVPSGHG